jgi:hypothetical protein
VSGDERRLERLVALGRAVGDDRDRVDARDVEALQRAQHLVLLARELAGRLLDGDDVAAEMHEAHEVPGDALREGRDVLVGPHLERGAPREVEQRGVDRRRGDVQ